VVQHLMMPANLQQLLPYRCIFSSARRAVPGIVAVKPEQSWLAKRLKHCGQHLSAIALPQLYLGVTSKTLRCLTMQRLAQLNRVEFIKAVAQFGKGISKQSSSFNEDL
jgi:hypothetical protein